MSTPRQMAKLDIRHNAGVEFDREEALKSVEKGNAVEPDDLPSQRAIAEAVRQSRHGDSYIVPADLEDDDQRTGAPGTREQE